MAFPKLFRIKKEKSKKDSPSLLTEKEEKGAVRESPLQKPGVPGSIGSHVLLKPHMSEKASILGEKQHTYVFQVHPRATKHAVKRAVEGVYGVKVEKVRMVRIPPKRIRVGRKEGVKKGFRKALVTVLAGQKIELLPK